MTRVLKASELVEGRGRGLSYIGFRLRRLVWADTEVRDVLLVAADDRAVWDELVGLLAARGASGFSSLDLVTAVSLKPGWSTGGWGAVSGPAPTMARRKTPPNPSVPDALSEYQGQRRGGAASKCRARRIGDLRSKLWSIPSPAPFTDAVGPSGSGHTVVPGDDPVRRHPRNAREPPGRGSPFSLSAPAERIRSSPRLPAAQGGHGWPLPLPVAPEQPVRIASVAQRSSHHPEAAVAHIGRQPPPDRAFHATRTVLPPRSSAALRSQSPRNVGP